MANRYWENEQPVVVDTGRNVIKYFEKSGKLQVCNPNWINDDGEARQGKTVTLDIMALRKYKDALDIFKQIVAS